MIRKRVFILILALVLSVNCLLPLSANAAKIDSKAGIVSVSSGYLNVRKSASTSSSIVSTLKKGSYITLISKSGNWWYIDRVQSPSPVHA